MAVATLALVGCKKTDEPVGPGPGPVDPQPAEAPDVAPTAGAITVVLNIPDGICKDVYMEGAYEGYSIDPAVATKFAEIAGFADWYQAVIPVADAVEDVTAYMGNCKVLLSDEAGAIPGDWSSQWNSDKVTITEESPAQLVDDMGQKAMNFAAEAVGGVVYITIGGWQSKPCVDYGVATALKIKAANIFNEDDEAWQWDDMVAQGNGVFTYELTVVDDSNLGANTGFVVDDEIVEAWNDLGNGETLGIQVGDKVRYTFTSENGPKGTMTIAVAN